MGFLWILELTRAAMVLDESLSRQDPDHNIKMSGSSDVQEFIGNHGVLASYYGPEVLLEETWRKHSYRAVPKKKVLCQLSPQRCNKQLGSLRGCCSGPLPAAHNDCAAKLHLVPHCLLCKAGSQPTVVLSAGVLVKMPPPYFLLLSPREKSH